jgi:hypothetical protein
MFKWLTKKSVQSDQGFIVKFTGKFTAEYRENEKWIEVEVDNGVMGGTPCISIRSSAFARWSSDGQAIQVEEQQRILKNFRDAMEFQGLAIYVW